MIDQTLSVLRSVKLSDPRVLWVLALAVLLVLFAARARLRMTSVGLRVGVLCLRLAIVGLLVLGLAQPTLRPPGHARGVIFAIDVSDSVTADQKQWAYDWVDRAIAALPPGSHADTLEFAERAQLAGSAASLSGGSTDLAAALRLSGTLVTGGKNLAPEVVLLTDGWHTAAAAPADALPAGIPISYVALPAPADGRQPLAVVHSLNVPPVARAGDKVDVIIDLQATQAVDALLRLTLDQTLVVNVPIHLDPGDTRLSLPQRIAAPGFVEVRAELQTSDSISTLASVVVAKPAARVLVLEDQASQADGLVTALNQAGLQIDRKTASSLPPSAAPLSAYDGIVLVNTPATSLSLDQQRTLVSYVQDMARGLMVVGGQRTFSPGGYQGTVLDDLLPVSAEPPIEPQQGSLALFLVIDRSGSMDILTGGSTANGGASKLAMAREAAIEAAGLLQPQDTLGVIAFDSSFQWVVQPTKLVSPDDLKRAQNLIGSIKPGGGTSILPPLEAAYQAAAKVDAPLRHVILLTDGESNDHGYEDLVARMKPDQITLSTLAIGSDADTKLLSNLAHIGGGRYYFTERSTEIPRIASKETAILTRNAVVEGHVAAVVAEPSPILRSLAGDLPALSGYVATTRKDRAITALETERGHPLLAHWQYGLGRVVAWTSDAQQGWASDWAAWPDAAQFWSQAIRWSLPAPVPPDFQASAQVGPDGRQVSLQVQALRDDGHFADLQDTRATGGAPDGSAREVALPQHGPGLYALDTRVSTPGVYRVLFKQGAREEVAAFSAPDSVERHSVGSNVALLDRLATTSGGHKLADVGDIARPGQGPAPTIDLWPWPVAAALLLLPFDIFLRRRA
ncbi:MAG: VWA domain-containing protein [Chloroflexota bacterium]|nr:VWA domain-containing protein [Chloroflexota bacterium]